MNIKIGLFITILTCLYTVSANAQTDTGKHSSTPSATASTPAQTGTLTGKLVDAKKNPVSYATVTLLRADSTVVNGDLTKDDGTFNIQQTGSGTFTLRIESIGLATKNVSVTIPAGTTTKDLGAIQVASTQNTLKDVAVVAEKPVMQMDVDKKVFNVEKNTTTAGGSATDVLSNVPSVSVDADGNVSLRGKSDVTILIDGKPSTMLGTDQASALQALPASSIESVEVITNPSAKYDAQGLTGIINIITKKDQRFGINGTVTAGVGTRDKYNGNISLNAHKGKWNVFLNSSARINNSFNNVTTNRYDNIPDSLGNKKFYHTYEHVPRHFGGFFNTVGATYDMNKYNSFTVTENVNIMNHAFKDYSNYNEYPSVNDQASSLFYQNRYTNTSADIMSLSSALDYKHKFHKKDEELSVDATFAATDFSRSQDYITYVDSETKNYPFNPITEHAPGTGGNSSFNAWADYTDPLFTPNGRLGLGFKSQVYWFNSSNSPLVDSVGRPQALDTSLWAAYNYLQQIHAGYINWNDQQGKFSYQLGLRAEYASYDGNDQVPTNILFKNSYFDLFPSAFVSYQLPAQQSIYLNYSRRTNRPNFFQLLPYKDLSNPGTISEGNPDLQPEFIHNIEFSYTKADNRGDNFILSAYYQYTQNLIERVTTLENSGPYEGLIMSTPQNLASGTTYGAEATGHIQILPIWDATLNLNFFQNDIKAGHSSDSNLLLADNSGFSWFGKINTNIKLPLGFSLQVNANYESPKVIAQGMLRETYWVDVALRKNFWKNKATLVMNCSDIFTSHSTYTTYNLPTYYENILREREGAIGNITFTYRFGKTDNGNKAGRSKEKKLSAPTQEDRENNLKQGDDNGGEGGGGQGQGGNGGGQGGRSGAGSGTRN